VVDVVTTVFVVEKGVTVLVLVVVKVLGVTVTLMKLLQSARCDALRSARVPVTARAQLFAWHAALARPALASMPP
jgi:hypothetical protein